MEKCRQTKNIYGVPLSKSKFCTAPRRIHFEGSAQELQEHLEAVHSGNKEECLSHRFTCSDFEAFIDDVLTEDQKSVCSND